MHYVVDSTLLDLIQSVVVHRARLLFFMGVIAFSIALPTHVPQNSAVTEWKLSYLSFTWEKSLLCFIQCSMLFNSRYLLVFNAKNLFLNILGVHFPPWIDIFYKTTNPYGILTYID